MRLKAKLSRTQVRFTRTERALVKGLAQNTTFHKEGRKEGIEGKGREGGNLPSPRDERSLGFLLPSQKLNCCRFKSLLEIQEWCHWHHGKARPKHKGDGSGFLQGQLSFLVLMLMRHSKPQKLLLRKNPKGKERLGREGWAASLFLPSNRAGCSKSISRKTHISPTATSSASHGASEVVLPRLGVGETGIQHWIRGSLGKHLLRDGSCTETHLETRNRAGETAPK